VPASRQCQHSLSHTHVCVSHTHTHMCSASTHTHTHTCVWVLALPLFSKIEAVPASNSIFEYEDTYIAVWGHAYSMQQYEDTYIAMFENKGKWPTHGSSKCTRFMHEILHIKDTCAGGLQVYEIIKCTYAGGLQVYEIICHIQRQREFERRCSVRGAGRAAKRRVFEDLWACEP